MYKKITIENFRGIKHLELEDLKKINLFVGKNNSRKTTVLEALFLLTGATNPRLPININIFRGLHVVNKNIFNAFFNELKIGSKIKISGELNDHPIEKRELSIKPNIKSTITIPENMDSQKIANKIKSRYSGTTQVINGLILECLITPGENRKRKRITSEIAWKEKGLEIKPPNNYIETLKGVFVNPNTIELDQHQRFDELQTKKQIPRLIKVLKQIDSSIESLTLGEGGIIKCDVGLRQLIPINLLGSGLAKILSILLAIATTENGIVLIDEIENGLYYSSQRKLWDAIFEFAKEYNVQIFASTHSIECIRALSESHAKLEKGKDNFRLFRMEIKNGNINTVKYDYKLLEASLDSGWEVR